MTRRPIVLGAVLCCIGAPALLVLLEAASSYSANRTTGTIATSAGQTREYILYVPKSYDRGKPAPLVISMHGAANWPSFQMNISQWNALADQHGFIVVYPGGEGGGPKTWLLSGGQTSARMPDVVFISELIDTLEASYNIDPARIYANGISNGGGAAYALSCTLPDRIAAFGPVAAAVTLPVDWCPGARPAPMIAFHGTNDRITPYAGAKVWIAPQPFPSIPEWTANWARRNRCAPNPIESAAAADVTRLEYTGCADNASVLLYTIEGGGHTWPGGPPLPEWLLGPTTRSIDATGMMWSFFREHPLRHVAMTQQKPDFSGEWILNREASRLNPGADGVLGGVVRIEHHEPTMRYTSELTTIANPLKIQWELTSDGREAVTTEQGRRTTISLRWDGDALVFDGTTEGGTRAVKISFRYELVDGGRRLRAVEQLRGTDHDQDNVWIFDRR